MNQFFIRGFIKDNHIGLNGAISVIEHFQRDNQELETLIFTIIKACKSLEEWTISIRYKDLKSPYPYGFSEYDLTRMTEQQQIEILQYYCNAYLVLYHLSQMSLNRLDSSYCERVDINLLQKEGGGLNDYLTKADKQLRDKWNRSLFQ